MADRRKLTKSQNLLFELLLVLCGKQKHLKGSYSDQDWEDTLVIANDQAIGGVLFTAIESLPADQYPNKYPTIHWWSNTQSIEEKSNRMKDACEYAIQFFREKGFPCQILKGTAVARYYTRPLRRSCGDIDIWLEGGRERIYALARSFDNKGLVYGANYHHIHFHLFDNILLEVHIWPSFLSSPLRNKRLHRFCNLFRPSMESDMPSLSFDRVFILLHCYRHMCGDGVGLRQIMDYYYVLNKGFNEDEKAESLSWIAKLGMKRFARGIMWILKNHFGMDDSKLLMSPDEKEGRFIMREIMLTGNMGHSDTRIWGSKKTPFSRFLLNLRRDIYLLGHYPHEVVWQPFFSIWLYVWRLSKGLLKDREIIPR